MSDFDIRIELRANDLPRLQHELRAQASAIVRKAAFDVEAEAKARAPVDTGYLRSSIRAEMTGDLSAEVDVGANYGIYVELGTRRQAAHPYLTPAAEVVRPAFDAAVRELLS